MFAAAQLSEYLSPKQYDTTRIHVSKYVSSQVDVVTVYVNRQREIIIAILT